MRSGDICIVAPSIIHALSAFSDDCVIYNFLIKSQTFEAVFLNSLPKYGTLHDFFSRALYSPGSQFYLYFKSGIDPQLVNLFKKILKEYQTQKRYTSSMINALLEIFFICLLRNHEKNMIAPNPAGKKQEKKIIFVFPTNRLLYKIFFFDSAKKFFQNRAGSFSADSDNTDPALSGRCRDCRNGIFHL